MNKKELAERLIEKYNLEMDMLQYYDRDGLLKANSTLRRLHTRIAELLEISHDEAAILIGLNGRSYKWATSEVAYNVEYNYIMLTGEKYLPNILLKYFEAGKAHAKEVDNGSFHTTILEINVYFRDKKDFIQAVLDIKDLTDDTVVYTKIPERYITPYKGDIYFDGYVIGKSK